MKKVFLLLCVAVVSSLFYSCKKDDGDLGGGYQDPTQVEDPDHVKVKDVYGITVACGKDQWTNVYQDTMPQSARYDDYKCSNITLGLYQDSMVVNAQSQFPTFIQLRRFFYKPTSAEDAYAYMEGYRQIAFVDLISADYEDVPTYQDISLNGYAAKYFTAVTGGSRTPAGIREVYMFYYNGTIYGVIVNVYDKYKSEDSYEKCLEVIKTLKLK